MEDYYMKYAKPINPFNYQSIIQNLQEWHNNAKEELEIYLFIIKELKNDTLNHYPQRDKIKTFNNIDKLKKVCQSQIQYMSDYLIELQGKNYCDIYEEPLYLKLESIRKNYNIMLVNNQKFIISMKFLIDLKNKYMVNKSEKQLALNKSNKKSSKHSKLKTTNIDIDYDILNYPLQNIHIYPINTEISKKIRNVDSYVEKAKSPFKNLMTYNTNGNNPTNNVQISFNKSKNNYTKSESNLRNEETSKQNLKHSHSFVNSTKRNERMLKNGTQQENNIFYNSTNNNVDYSSFNQHYNKNNTFVHTSGNNIAIQNLTIHEKLLQENQELKDEIKSIKSQLNIMSESIKLLSEKVAMVQKENTALKQHNQTLVNLIEKGLELK